MINYFFSFDTLSLGHIVYVAFCKACHLFILLVITYYYLTHVYHLATQCYHLTPDMLLLGKTPCYDMTCHQTNINLLAWLVTWWISPLIMLSLDTRHDTPDSYNYHDNGNDDRTSWFTNLIYMISTNCTPDTHVIHYSTYSTPDIPDLFLLIPGIW